ncbi:hypothetical protein HIM_05866 [Hirsutella minnesotensis 3608]|uniref:NADP-dependent oxidoreductase domain-containing protein n=1 Tax=Hirsutella minnesotensis 3608 TaxID=1043627 RepID=A0A0F8A557_9HYPO|nr:hypothetical protein HIM_05866 [Hirsutella minnesotensis 3608]
MVRPTGISDTVTFSNSIEAPRLGFGVYKSPPELCKQSCRTALDCGYRRIDTGQFYDNEEQVGQAVRESGLPRGQVFLTTKILHAGGSVEASYQKCLKSVELLDAEDGYIDEFLIHSPNCGPEKRREMWLALERLYQEGKTKSIGVSNYGIKHMDELKQYAKVWPPHVLQIELHPWLQQNEVVEYCKANGIVVEAYCPLVRNKKADDKTLTGIAEKHKTAPNKVLVRYCLQKGWVPLPKSDNAERIRANADVYGFELDADDMAKLDGLDQGPAGAIVMAVDNY